MSRISFTSSRRKENQSFEGKVDSKTNDVVWVSGITDHKLREIDRHVVLPSDEMVML